MDKIASPAQLQTELRNLLDEARTQGVSREVMASKLRSLADRVAKKPGTDSAAEAKELKTKDLYTKTLELLKQKKMGPARAYIDELSSRKDNKKELPGTKELGITGPYAESIQDRIDLVNSKTASSPLAKYEV